MIRMDKFTVLSQEAMPAASRLAMERSHQQIDAEHLLLAMLKQDNSLAKSRCSPQNSRFTCRARLHMQG